VTALGDTLFPSASLQDGLTADLSPTAHVLIRLRTIHPVLAVMVALYLTAGAWRFAGRRPLGWRAAHFIIALLGTQLALGFLNVLLLAPVWLQLVHLLVADAIWLAYVLLAADVLASPTLASTTAPVVNGWQPEKAGQAR
jgi:heme A synthase